MKNLLLLISLSILLANCRSSKEAIDQYKFFDKHLDTLNTLVNQLKDPIILEGDQLDIAVYSGSLNQDQVKVFVLGSESKTGYGVDPNGDINMPVLGKLHVEGLTKPQLEKLLLDKLEPYVKNPVVNISFLNFRVLTLGEVTRQGFQLVNEKSTLVDAIAQAGGLTESAERKNILLIRQLTGGKKQYTYFNLNDASVFASPYFQLQQNDIIYVQPNNSKLVTYGRANNPLFRDLPAYIGLFTAIISIVTVILVLRR
jgi:polysaccharide export outer membrane protein